MAHERKSTGEALLTFVAKWKSCIVRLRPPSLEDGESLLAFFAALSPESLYRRFHGFPRLDARVVEPLLAPDWHERGALLASLADAGEHEEAVAVANYVRLRDPALAE